MRNRKILSVLKNYWALLTIIFVTLSIEIFVASRKSMWVDEFFSWAVIKRPLIDILFLSKEFCRWYMNSFPPLYEMMVHLFLNIIHYDSVLALRLLSIISFLASIVLIYVLTNLISKNRKASLLASFFIAFNPAYFLYGGMLRGYAFFVLMTTISFLLIYGFLNRKDKIKLIISIGFTWTAMIYLSYFSVLIICVQAFFLRFYILKMGDKKLYYYLLFCFSMPFILFIPWAHNLGTDIFIEILAKKGSGPVHINFASILHFLSKGNWIFVVHFVFFFFTLFYFYKHRKNRKSESNIFILLMALCFLVYIILIVFSSLSKISINIHSPLYIRYVLPVFYIAFVLNSIFIVSQKKVLAGVLIFFMISFSLLSFYNSKYYTPKGALFDIKSVAAYLKKCNFHNQRTVLFFEDVMVIPGFIYYYSNPHYAYLATTPYYGNVRGLNRALNNKNITIAGNIIGVDYYCIKPILENDYDTLVILDTGYFNSLNFDTHSSFHSGKDNFIRDIKEFIKKEHLKYELKEKHDFRGFTVAVYKKI